MPSPEPVPEHHTEVPEDPVTSLNLVEMAAEAWGGSWQAEPKSNNGPEGGRLVLPVAAGLRYGWVAGPVTVEAVDGGSRLSFRIEESDYKVRKDAAFTLVVAALGALVTIFAPLVPALWRLVPVGIMVSVVGWLFIIARLRNSGPEEFFQDLAGGKGD